MHTGENVPPQSPAPAVFSEAFLKSIRAATVSSIKRKFFWKQPPEVEKLLADSNLPTSRGMSLGDEEGEGKNLLLIGVSDKDITRAIRRGQGQRRVRPFGMGFDQYAATKNPKPSRFKLRLKFGPDKAHRRPKVQKMLCETHGLQAVKSPAKGSYLLTCGCRRGKDIKA